MADESLYLIHWWSFDYANIYYEFSYRFACLSFVYVMFLTEQSAVMLLPNETNDVRAFITNHGTQTGSSQIDVSIPENDGVDSSKDGLSKQRRTLNQSDNIETDSKDTKVSLCRHAPHCSLLN